MNERERWIVYPLLFFALGSALRDKFLQHVSTKDLECQQLIAKQIVCEDLSVRDPTKPDRRVARLTSGAPEVAPGKPGSDYFGVLLLLDSENKESCHVTNQVVAVREMNCLALKVVDPDNNARALAALASAAAPPAEPGGPPRRFGVLALNNQEFGQLVGNPPPNPNGAPPTKEEQPPGTPNSEDPGEAPAAPAPAETEAASLTKT